MLVIVFNPGARARTRTFSNWVSVVESEKPFAPGIVQRQRIIEAVGLCGTHRDLSHLEPHPEETFHNECLAIQLEQSIQAAVSINVITGS